MGNRNLSGEQFFDAYDVEAANTFQGDRELAQRSLGDDPTKHGFARKYRLGHLPAENIPEMERATSRLSDWDEEIDEETGKGVDTLQVEGILRVGVDKMPPVRAAIREGKPQLADGRHRVAAAYRDRRKAVPAYIPFEDRSS